MEAGVSTYICLTFHSWTRSTVYPSEASLRTGALTGRVTFGNETRWSAPHRLEGHGTVTERACLPSLQSRTVQKWKQFLSICSSTFLPILRTSEMAEPKHVTSPVCKPCCSRYCHLLSPDFFQPMSMLPERSSWGRGAEVLCRDTFYCAVNKQLIFLKGSNAKKQFRVFPIPNIWFWSSAYVTNRWST